MLPYPTLTTYPRASTPVGPPFRKFTDSFRVGINTVAGPAVQNSEPKGDLFEVLHRILAPCRGSALADNEAFVVLDVARARREVCRAEQALANSLADEHAAVSELYRLHAQTLGDVLHPLELNVGVVLAAMRRHGIDEQDPGLSKPSDPRVETSSQMQIDSDGTITKSVGDRLLHIRLD